MKRQAEAPEHEAKRRRLDLAVGDVQRMFQQMSIFALFSTEGTLLDHIPTDLNYLISAYWLHLKAKDKPLLKESYTFQNQFGCRGQAQGQFQSPEALAVNAAGDIYVADAERIQVFLKDGQFSRAFSLGKTFTPCALVVDLDGNVVVVFHAHHKVQVFDGSGQFQLEIGSGKGSMDGEFKSPSAVAVDLDGNYVIADMKNHRLQVFKRSTGVWLRTIDLAIDPSGVSVDALGNFIVSSANKIYKFKQDGERISSFSTFGMPSQSASAVDRNGRMVFGDIANNRLILFSSLGGFIRILGKRGNQEGEMNCPIQPAISSEGNIIFLDKYNNRVQIWE